MFYCHLAALLILLFCTSAWAGKKGAVPSHCSAAETTVFSCEIHQTKKVASICASSTVSAPGGYVQYRFGRLKAPEMKFPVQAERWEKVFSATHYFRSRVDRRELSFLNEGFRYTVFSSYESEQSPAEIHAGIMVGKESDAEGRVLYCKKHFIDNLGSLDAVIVPDAGP